MYNVLILNKQSFAFVKLSHISVGQKQKLSYICISPANEGRVCKNYVICQKR